MSTNNIEELHRATLQLLKQTGVYIGSDRALDIYEEYSVRVDRADKRVFPDEKQIERALASAPGSFLLYGRNDKTALHFDGSKIYFLSGGASLRVLDMAGNYTAANLKHLHQFNILLDALPNIHVMINQVDPHEFHGKNLYPLLAAEMLIDTPKPICMQASTAGDVKVMFEMGSVVRGTGKALAERPLFFVGLNAEPPMAISGEIADALLACCEMGIPCSLGNYNMMGITAPRTVPGAVVQLNAVQLTAVILMQAHRPGHSMFYTAFSGSGNMRTLDPITSDPLSVQQQRLAVLLGRSYGLPVYSFAGTDSRMPDSQAACEHALQFQIAMDSGCNLLQGPTSMMDQMMLSSFAQAIIDHDIISYILECRKTPDFSSETFALDVINEAVTDPDLKDMKYSAHRHTVSHINEGSWNPLSFSYDNFSSWQKNGEKSLVNRANEEAARIIGSHRPDPLRPVQAESIRAVCAEHTS
jgi:trimethylamine--corrinoid protein Co-methyltransferase